MKVQFNNLYHLHKKIKNNLILSFKKHIYNSDFIGGNEVTKFENKFKTLNKSKYCISCANGSDALLIAIKSLGLKPGDEVITTAFSWIATSASITLAGGKVVFCDIEKDGFNINVKEIEKKITKKTVGIIPVHLYGYPADMTNIMKIAKKNHLWVVEDCAQSHLASIKNKNVGNFGNFGTFSFFPGKNLGALGDAGCLVTNNENLAKKAKLIATHGGKGKHLIEGVNSRLDSIQASFLNIKIGNLKKDTGIRIKNANIYFKNLRFIKNIKLPKITNNHKSVYHQFTIRLKNRNLFQNHLKKYNIETQVHYKKILPAMSAYKSMKLNSKNFPNATKASKEILCLPISQSINNKMINFIIKKIILFFKK